MCAPLEDADAPVCAAPAKTQVYIGKCRPLALYPRWARLVIRFVYWLTDYSAGQESAGIADTWEEAEALVASQEIKDGQRDSYFGIELPVGALLPDEPCQLNPTRFFKTDAPGFYARYRPKFVAVPTEPFEKLSQKLEVDTLSTNGSAARHA